MIDIQVWNSKSYPEGKNKEKRTHKHSWLLVTNMEKINRQPDIIQHIHFVQAHCGEIKILVIFLWFEITCNFFSGGKKNKKKTLYKGGGQFWILI